jgi:hypothetical protein
VCGATFFMKRLGSGQQHAASLVSATRPARLCEFSAAKEVSSVRHLQIMTMSASGVAGAYCTKSFGLQEGIDSCRCHASFEPRVVVDRGSGIECACLAVWFYHPQDDFCKPCPRNTYFKQSRE